MIRRAAGALVLSLQDAPDLTVFMIQRPRSMRHFPCVWSFPGGQMEVGDRGGRTWVDSGSWEIGKCLSTEGYLRRWAVHAPPVDSWLPADELDMVQVAARTAWRETLEELGAGLEGALAADGHMRYLGRLSPPPQVAFGFDTRFFLLTVPPFQTVLETAEVAQARWITVSQALDSGMPMARPTHYVLESLLSCLRARASGRP